MLFEDPLMNWGHYKFVVGDVIIHKQISLEFSLYTLKCIKVQGTGICENDAAHSLKNPGD